MARVIGKALIAFAVIAALLIISGLVITLREPKFAWVPMPNPNGYEDLLFAAQLIVSLPSPGTNQSSEGELAKSVSQNARALQLAKDALTRECRVSLDGPFQRSLRLGIPSPSFRALAQAFLDEAKLAELENRPADAAQSYLSISRMGQEIMRGGVLVDAIVGSSVEMSGLGSLERLAARLDFEQCKQLIAALDSADVKRETVENVVHQEKIWGRHAYGWRYYMHPIVIAQQKHRAGCITVESDRTRKLMIALAARAFELERGAKPKSINDLVPGYLKTIPRDAFTGKNMAYPP